MLEKRIGAVAVILGEEVWVIGGGDGNGSASTEILELEANDPINWKWKSGPQLLNARYGSFQGRDTKLERFLAKNQLT